MSSEEQRDRDTKRGCFSGNEVAVLGSLNVNVINLDILESWCQSSYLTMTMWALYQRHKRRLADYVIC